MTEILMIYKGNQKVTSLSFRGLTLLNLNMLFCKNLVYTINFIALLFYNEPFHQKNYNFQIHFSIDIFTKKFETSRLNSKIYTALKDKK